MVNLRFTHIQYLVVVAQNLRKVVRALCIIIKIKIHSSCEIEDFVETHLCKLCVMFDPNGKLFVVVVLTLTRIIKSVVTGQAPATLELRNTRGKNTNNPRWYTHISQLTQVMPPPETYKSEIGSQPTMCQVHTGAHVSLLTPGETDYYTAPHPRETTTYILHVVSITTHTPHDRRKSIGDKEQRKEKIKERKGKKREQSETK